MRALEMCPGAGCLGARCWPNSDLQCIAAADRYRCTGTVRGLELGVADGSLPEVCVRRDPAGSSLTRLPARGDWNGNDN